MVPRFAVTSARLDPAAVAEAALRDPESGRPDEGRAGGIVTFTGAVRALHQGRRVVRIDYEAYAPLALACFERIARESGEWWPSARLAVHHRTGPVGLGEASVVIVAASPHRAEAFAACRYAIERVKQIAPVWKHEYFEDGESWVEGATADPEDEAARERARSTACA